MYFTNENLLFISLITFVATIATLLPLVLFIFVVLYLFSFLFLFFLFNAFYFSCFFIFCVCSNWCFIYKYSYKIVFPLVIAFLYVDHNFEIVYFLSLFPELLDSHFLGNCSECIITNSSENFISSKGVHIFSECFIHSL